MKYLFTIRFFLSTFALALMAVVSSAQMQPIKLILHSPPPSSLTRNLRVSLLKSSTDASYKLLIGNSNDKKSSVKLPSGIRITAKGNSIRSIVSGEVSGWRRTPSKFPPASSIVQWMNNSGSIPIGQIDLGDITFTNLTVASIEVSYEWLKDNGEILTKDKATNDREK